MINKITHKTIEILRKLYMLIGLIFLGIASSILRKDNRYLLISETIENAMESEEIFLKVMTIENHPLYIRFILKVASTNNNKFNNEYFIKELVHRFGCSYTDIKFEFDKKDRDYGYYHLDVTKTALSNLEKGTSQYIPEMFVEAKPKLPVKNLGKRIMN